MPRARWTFAQWAIVVVAGLQIVWATAGLIAEPSFHFGEGAPTQVVLGVDFNGVHAISGYLLFGPAFFFALRPRWALRYAIFVAVALSVTGIWAAFSTSPAGIFAFPDNTADAILHISTGAVFAAIAAIQLGLDRNTQTKSTMPTPMNVPRNTFH